MVEDILDPFLCAFALNIDMSLLLVQLSDALEISGEVKRDIPFVIMTSDDTHLRTLELLKTNNYFGMNPKQVHLLKQVTVTVDGIKVILTYKNSKCYTKSIYPSGKSGLLR